MRSQHMSHDIVQRLNIYIDWYIGHILYMVDIPKENEGYIAYIRNK